MSDNYLIREAREWYGHGDLQTLTGNLLTRLADALEAANTRVARIERLLEHIDAARAGYDALVARANQFEKALREMIETAEVLNEALRQAESENLLSVQAAGRIEP